jgi:NTP pyrophosphatase (non-canonical NTP hydrolase)
MSDGIFRNDFDLDVAREVESARSKFPRPDGLLAALTEEVGEVARALLDKPWSEVYAEAVQVAAMAQRLAQEGDPTMTDIRSRRGLDSPEPGRAA